jgi:ribosome-associated toxin RatA of RatAB toxin-antitoxin module
MKGLTAERLVAIDLQSAERLVRDVESYPKFVPGLRDLQVASRRKLRSGEEVTVRAFFALRSMSGSFNARLVFSEDGRNVTAELIKGPFELLRCEVGLEKAGANTVVRATANYTTNIEIIDKVIRDKLDLYLDLLKTRIEERCRLAAAPLV